MKNLNKALALIVAIAMVASFGTISALAAFPDVPSDASYAEAANLLNELGILTGDENGNFNPDKTLTRAEAAALIVRTLGMESAAVASAGATSFSDVPADNWAAGYVNVAEQQGIINGMGDGTFNPSGELTYEQIIKIIVAAIGYTPRANVSGGYPSGYLLIASQTGITRGATGTTGQPVARSTVARLIYNALEVEMMEQTSFVAGQGTTYATNGKTILTDCLGKYKVNAIVTDTYTFSQNVSSGKVTLYLDDDVEDRFENIVYDGETDLTFDVGGTNADAYLGYAVVAYVGEDDDTGNDTIYAISPRTARNNTLTIAADEFYPGGNDEDDNKIGYYDANDKAKTLKINTEEDIIIVLNGEEAYNYDIADLYDIENTILENGGTAMFLDNDNDNEYEYVFFYTIASGDEFVVTSIDEEEFSIEGDPDGYIAYDFDDDDASYVFYKNNVKASFSDIEVGDLVSLVRNDGSETIVTTYISSVTVEGTVSDRSSDSGSYTYTINGQDYKLSDAYDSDEIAAGDEGIFYINYLGKIAYTESTSTNSASGAYAFALSVYQKSVDDASFDDNSYGIRMVLENGSVVKKDFASKIKVVSYDESDRKFTTSSRRNTEDILGTYFEIGDDFQVFDPTAEKQTQGLIKYEVNTSDQIDVIYIANNASGGSVSEPATNASGSFAVYKNMLDNTTRSYSKSKDSIQNVYFGTDTIVFNIKLEDGAVTDEGDVSVSTTARSFKDDSVYQFIAYDGYGNNSIAKAVVALDSGASNVDAESNVFVVSNVSETSVDGSSATKLTGYISGSETSYIIYDDEEDVDFTDVYGNADAYSESDLMRGQVLIVSVAASGYVDGIQVLVDLGTTDTSEASIDLFAESIPTAEGDDSDVVLHEGDDATNVYGQFAEKNSNRINLYCDSTDNIEDLDGSYVPSIFNTDYDGFEDFLTSASGVNFYLVDFSGSRISVKSTSSPFTTSTVRNDDDIRVPKYPQGVYVRYYEDDDMKDVVVFKFAEI
ncbi:MAG: S-layer homology domain-containing protein [Clostridia bacterium]|nr:S-layer homology domain-containing protein [Clostridia bacterium]